MCVKMLELKNFRDLNEEQKWLVLSWRNHQNISKFMRTKRISQEEHFKFLEELKQSKTKKYFLLFRDKEPLGVIYFTNITLDSCEFGIYQNPDLKGNGAALMQKMLQYAQETLGVKSIYACALNTNQKAISLYQRFGFQFTNKDAQMSYFVFSAGGGFVVLKATLFYSLATQTAILAIQDSILCKMHKFLKNAESQSLRAIPSSFSSLCA